MSLHVGFVGLYGWTPDTFKSLSFPPNAVPGVDGHYKPFSDVYGLEEPAEKHRPSLQLRKKKASSFSPSQQHVKNVNVLVQCEECDKWRLLFCKHKLSPQEVTDLQVILEDCHIHVAQHLKM